VDLSLRFSKKLPALIIVSLYNSKKTNEYKLQQENYKDAFNIGGRKVHSPFSAI